MEYEAPAAGVIEGSPIRSFLADGLAAILIASLMPLSAHALLSSAGPRAPAGYRYRSPLSAKRQD
jgi:hypothetical protein